MYTVNHYTPEDNNSTQRGHLVELNEWDEATAHLLAAEENITLTEEHMDILHYLRNYYDKNGQSYNARKLMNVLEYEFGRWQGKSSLYQLFPKAPAVQASKIAGLPLPPKNNSRSFDPTH